MMKIKLGTLLLIMATTLLRSQVTLKWVDNLIGGGSTGGKSIVHDDKNRIYATSDYNSYAHIIRFNQNTGARKWNDSILNTESVKLKVVNGFLYFIGNYQNNGGTSNPTDFLVAKYDSLGNKLWQAIYNDSLDYTDYVIDMEIDNSGNVYVSGNTEIYNGSSMLNQRNLTVIKYDVNGQMVWKSRYGAPSSAEIINDLAIDNFGNSYVAGIKQLYSGDPDFFLLKFNANGTPGWSYIFNNNTGWGIHSDGADRVAVNSLNEIVVAGVVEGQGGGPYNVYVAKFNGTGTKLWQNKFHEGDCRGVRFLAIDKNNTIYLAAVKDSASLYGHIVAKYNNQGVLKKVNNSGNWSWGGAFNDHHISGAYFDKYSSLYITGFSGQQLTRDCYIMKYDSLMQNKWSYYYSSQASFPEEKGYSICVDSLQDVYVTGYNYQNSTTRMLTYKLCQIKDFCGATTTATLGLGFTEKSVAKLKFNSDNYDDLIFSDSINRSLKIYIGNSSNTYSYATTFSYSWTPNHLINADINNDGLQDLLVHNSTDDNVAVIFSNGAGGFTAPVFYSSAPGINSVMTADFNHDGYQDIFTQSKTQNLFSVLMNNGNGTFNAPINTTHNSNFDLIAIGDVNGDQYPDVIASSSTFANTVYKYINTGSLSFNSSSFVNTSYFRNRILLGKFDNDGYIDMVEVASNGLAYLNKGDGSGGFTGIGNLIGGSTAISDAVTFDYNRDGRGDFLYADKNSNTLKMFLSYGCTGGYQLSSTYTLGMPSGKLTELVVNGYNTVINGIPTSTVVSIWNNQCELATHSGVVTFLNNSDEKKPIGLNFSVYPNPFSDEITCSFSNTLSKEAFVEIVNIVGEIILRVPVNQQEKIHISLANFVPGVYLIKLTSDLGTEIQKTIKVN